MTEKQTNRTRSNGLVAVIPNKKKNIKIKNVVGEGI